MPQYLLTVWHDENYDEVDFDSPEMQRTLPKVDAVNQEMMDAGVWVFAGGLHSAASATVVRADGDQVSTIDGPYAESKEQMGGFWIIQADDLDAALAWARKGTLACERPIEVRPFHDAP